MAKKGTKRERFVKIAVARTNKIIDTLRLLGNCSTTSNYEYDDADVKKIFSAIEKELKNTRMKFADAGQRDEKKFKL